MRFHHSYFTPQYLPRPSGPSKEVEKQPFADGCRDNGFDATSDE
jgi:hypothetical protein